MSIQYGLSYGSEDDPEAKKESDERYQALNEEEKSFYHDGLPWILFGVGIGRVTEKTIPHILWRCSVIYPENWSKWNDKEKKENTLELFLKKVIGYGTNVGYETDKEFFKKVNRKLVQKFEALNLIPISRDDCWPPRKKVKVVENPPKEEKHEADSVGSNSGSG